jgi:hypothetical protein
MMDALSLPVSSDFGKAALDDALALLGDPKNFVIVVHPYAKHYAIHIAFPDHHDEKSMAHDFKVRLNEELDEDEWMIEDPATGRMVHSGF